MKTGRAARCGPPVSPASPGPGLPGGHSALAGLGFPAPQGWKHLWGSGGGAWNLGTWRAGAKDFALGGSEGVRGGTWATGPPAQPTLGKSKGPHPGSQRAPQISEAGSQGLHLTMYTGGARVEMWRELGDNKAEGTGVLPTAPSGPTGRGVTGNREELPCSWGRGQRPWGHSGLPASTLGPELGARPVGQGGGGTVPK